MTETERDPLAERVHRVVDVVKALRDETADLRTQLDAARQRIDELDAERGTIRRRVQLMLEHVAV